MTTAFFTLYMVTHNQIFFIATMSFLSLSVLMSICDFVTWVGEPIKYRTQMYWYSDWRYVYSVTHNEFLSVCISNVIVLFFDAYVFFRDIIGYIRLCVNVVKMIFGGI